MMSSIHASKDPPDFSIQELGPRTVASPYRVRRYVSDKGRTLYHTTIRPSQGPTTSPDLFDQTSGFELAGPRKNIYFDPSKIRCGIVTCGGLCPGLNAVIRAIVLQLYHCYGVRLIYGFRYGFEGLMPEYGHPALMLDPAKVSDIHLRGGSILSSSRGPQPESEIVDALERLNVQVLFCLGGDGTFRAAQALCRENQARALKISVVAVPKTIDNDVPFTSRTFGFETAYSVASEAIRRAHVEAMGTPHGIGLVKLMGRHAGFIAAHAVMASRDANFVLVPEVDFELAGENGLLSLLFRRLEARKHAVIVVAEGAGQNLFDEDDAAKTLTDASGNKRLKDIGVLLRDRISEYLKWMGMAFSVKYIDPSYLIRSTPATASDSLFAGMLGQMAVHAALAGKTAMFVGYWNDQFTHVPLAAAVARTKRLDPEGNFWQSVLECTGQPGRMLNTADETDIVEADDPADSCLV